MKKFVVAAAVLCIGAAARGCHDYLLDGSRF
jgi:hypothetical protein